MYGEAVKAEDAVEYLNGNGLRASCLPFSRMGDVRNDLEGLAENGALDRSILEYIGPLAWTKPEDFQNASSVVIVSMPQPALRTSFAVNGQKISALIPPTYTGTKKTIEEVKAKLDSFAQGHRFEYVRLPMKTLATRSGLARYGRNNITYVEGFGSFHRLIVFLTDLECGSDRWQEKKMLERCEKCTTCLKLCPTQSITLDRFLIHAQTCLTFLNEKQADVPFPTYVRPETHNAIVGCMVCQMKCPEDRKYLGHIEERPGFSEAETSYLLKGDFSNVKKAREMEKRLEAIGLDLSIFPRNLAALIERERFEEPMGIPG